MPLRRQYRRHVGRESIAPHVSRITVAIDRRFIGRNTDVRRIKKIHEQPAIIRRVVATRARTSSQDRRVLDPPGYSGEMRGKFLRVLPVFVDGSVIFPLDGNGERGKRAGGESTSFVHARANNAGCITSKNKIIIHHPQNNIPSPFGRTNRENIFADRKSSDATRDATSSCCCLGIALEPLPG